MHVELTVEGRFHVLNRAPSSRCERHTDSSMSVLECKWLRRYTAGGIGPLSSTIRGIGTQHSVRVCEECCSSWVRSPLDGIQIFQLQNVPDLVLSRDVLSWTSYPNIRTNRSHSQLRRKHYPVSRIVNSTLHEKWH